MTKRTPTDIAFNVSSRGARRGPISDIDLLEKAPAGTSTLDFLTFKSFLEQVLGREIDLIGYGGLKPGIDDDIRRDAVRL